MRISVTSTTSKLLLAIGPRPLFRRGSFLFPDGQVHPDTHAMHMDNYVIGVSNNVIVNRSTLGNSVSVHTVGTPHRSAQPQTGRPQAGQTGIATRTLSGIKVPQVVRAGAGAGAPGQLRAAGQDGEGVAEMAVPHPLAGAGDEQGAAAGAGE